MAFRKHLANLTNLLQSTASESKNDALTADSKEQNTSVKNFKTVFAVIDIQKSFTKNMDNKKELSLIEQLKKSLDKAIKEKNYILIVNYAPDEEDPKTNKDEEELHPEIRAMIEAYPHKYTILKKIDNGGRYILDHLQKENILFDKICISGVNTCACVRLTVSYLSVRSENHFSIEINKSCCACSCEEVDKSHPDSLFSCGTRKCNADSLQDFKNVTIIKNEVPCNNILSIGSR